MEELGGSEIKDISQNRRKANVGQCCRCCIRQGKEGHKWRLLVRSTHTHTQMAEGEKREPNDEKQKQKTQTENKEIRAKSIQKKKGDIFTKK